MLPLAILLLVCSLALEGVGATVPPCDPSLVNGPAGEFTFDNTTKKLTCNGADKVIDHGHRYFELACNDQRGWLHEDKPLNYPVTAVAANETFEFGCLEACDKSLITGIVPGKVFFNGFALMCESSEEAIKFTDGDKELLRSPLYCYVGQFWQYTINNIDVNSTIKYTDKITIECVKAACDETLVTLGKGVKRENNKITCENPEGKLLVENSSDDEPPESYNVLECKEEYDYSYWIANNNASYYVKGGMWDFSVNCDKQPIPTTTTTTTTTTTAEPKPAPNPAVETGNSAAFTDKTPQVSTMLLIFWVILGRNFV